MPKPKGMLRKRHLSPCQREEPYESSEDENLEQRTKFENDRRAPRGVLKVNSAGRKKWKVAAMSSEEYEPIEQQRPRGVTYQDTQQDFRYDILTLVYADVHNDISDVFGDVDAFVSNINPYVDKGF